MQKFCYVIKCFLSTLLYPLWICQCWVGPSFEQFQQRKHWHCQDMVLGSMKLKENNLNGSTQKYYDGRAVNCTKTRSHMGSNVRICVALKWLRKFEKLNSWTLMGEGLVPLCVIAGYVSGGRLTFVGVCLPRKTVLCFVRLCHSVAWWWIMDRVA